MDSAKGELSHHSSGAISISPKVTGDVGIPKYLDLVDGDIIVKFGRRNAILFEASGVEHQMIEEVDKIDNMIEKESEIGNWKKNWVVITDLLIADSATVLISNEKDAFVVLKAKAEVPNLPLANLSASFEAAYKQNMQTAITCQSGLTPLFQLRGVIKPLFGKPKYGGIRTKGMTIDNLPQSISSKRTEIMVGDIEFEPFK